MKSGREFSITAVILGLILIAGGMIPLAVNIQTRMAATYKTLKVVSQRESTCSYGRGPRRDPCAYPVVVNVDAAGKKHFFELQPRRTERLRWELKKSNNTLEVLYLENSPSPDDDKIFENDNDALFSGFLCALFGAVLLWMECYHYKLRRPRARPSSTASN